MRRRTYIGALVVAGSGTVAGCGSLANLGGPSKDPDEVAEEVFQALDDGDMEKLQSLMHSDRGGVVITESELERWETADIEIRESEVVESGGGEAVVDVTYGREGGSDEETIRLELRTEDGEWRIWDAEGR